jgi:hypothetical protein
MMNIHIPSVVLYSTKTGQIISHFSVGRHHSDSTTSCNSNCNCSSSCCRLQLSKTRKLVRILSILQAEIQCKALDIDSIPYQICDAALRTQKADELAAKWSLDGRHIVQLKKRKQHVYAVGDTYTGVSIALISHGSKCMFAHKSAATYFTYRVWLEIVLTQSSALFWTDLVKVLESANHNVVGSDTAEKQKQSGMNDSLLTKSGYIDLGSVRACVCCGTVSPMFRTVADAKFRHSVHSLMNRAMQYGQAVHTCCTNIEKYDHTISADRYAMVLFSSTVGFVHRIPLSCTHCNTLRIASDIFGSWQPATFHELVDDKEDVTVFKSQKYHSMQYACRKVAGICAELWLCVCIASSEHAEAVASPSAPSLAQRLTQVYHDHPTDSKSSNTLLHVPIDEIYDSTRSVVDMLQSQEFVMFEQVEDRHHHDDGIVSSCNDFRIDASMNPTMMVSHDDECICQRHDSTSSTKLNSQSDVMTPIPMHQPHIPHKPNAMSFGVGSGGGATLSGPGRRGRLSIRKMNYKPANAVVVVATAVDE